MSQPTASDADRRARDVGAALYERDRAAHELGIQILEVRAGYARLSMKVEDWMVQGHDICHGGFIFTLADTAMAYASNSHNENHVALNANIDFLRPAARGETLIAEAREGNRTRRTGMYDVSIVNAEGKAVGHFRGRTFGVGGTVMREASNESPP